MNDELQRQINDLRHTSDPIRHSISETNTTTIRQKSEVDPLPLYVPVDHYIQLCEKRAQNRARSL